MRPLVLAVLVCIAVSVAGSSPAGAVLVSGIFSGQVNSGTDDTNEFGLGAGASLVGQPISGRFSYDLASVPPNTCVAPACYEDQGGPDWLAFFVTINGVSKSLLLGGNLSERILSVDETLTGFDEINIREEDSGGDFNQGITTLIFGVAGIDLSEFNGAVLAPGGSIPTDFSWPAAPGSGLGSGVFSITYEIINGNLGTDTFLHSVSAEFDLTSASARIVPEGVVEPTTVSLFATGLLVVAFGCGRRTIRSTSRHVVAG